MEVTLFAWEHGIPSLESIGNWNGYQVFAPKHTANANGEDATAILANGNEVRFATGAELANCLN